MGIKVGRKDHLMQWECSAVRFYAKERVVRTIWDGVGAMELVKWCIGSIELLDEFGDNRAVVPAEAVVYDAMALSASGARWRSV